MNLTRRALVVVFVVAVGMAIGLWQISVYFPVEVMPIEVNSKSATRNVLIVTEATEYKDAVVKGVINYLQSESINASVVGCSSLQNVIPKKWDSIVILHSWNWGGPPAPVADFLKSNRDSNKMLVLTTSTFGDAKTANVDAISGASAIENAPKAIEAIIFRLEEKLNRSIKP